MIGHYKTPFGWIEYEINGVSLLRVSWMDIQPKQRPGGFSIP